MSVPIPVAADEDYGTVEIDGQRFAARTPEVKLAKQST